MTFTYFDYHSLAMSEDYANHRLKCNSIRREYNNSVIFTTDSDTLKIIRKTLKLAGIPIKVKAFRDLLYKNHHTFSLTSWEKYFLIDKKDFDYFKLLVTPSTRYSSDAVIIYIGMGN